MNLPEAYCRTWFRAGLRGRKPPHFGVVTACNPQGKIASPAKNRAADARLRRYLEKLKIRHFRVTGGDKEGTHREPGWGVVVEKPEQARLIAKRFRQKAYFWISSCRIFLGKSSGGPLVRAGSWTARQARWRP